MKAVILCGGRGTRIRDVSEVLPKPMLPIGNKPILWHIMKTYAQHGVKDFILCLGYKGWKIKEFFLFYRSMLSDFTIDLSSENEIKYHSSRKNEEGETKGAEEDWTITFAETGESTHTGARVWKIRKYLENEEDFCLTYGDGVSDVDISSLIDFHREGDSIGTLTGVRPLGRFGEIEFENNKITEFNEKPNVSHGRVNGGFMVFSTQHLWKHFTEAEDFTLESNLLASLVTKKNLSIFEHDGFWQCMDTPREFEMLNDLWSQKKAPWRVWK